MFAILETPLGLFCSSTINEEETWWGGQWGRGGWRGGRVWRWGWVKCQFLDLIGSLLQVAALLGRINVGVVLKCCCQADMSESTASFQETWWVQNRLQHVSLQHVLLQHGLSCIWWVTTCFHRHFTLRPFCSHVLLVFCKQRFYSACTRHQFSL